MARASSIGGIFAELTLRDKKFATGLKGAGAKLRAFGTAAARYGAMAGAAIGAGLLVGTKRTISMGAELDHLSTQTGVAVDDLMRIQQAYKDSGKAATSAGKDINRMQKAIFDASQNPGAESDPFAQIGLSVQELMEMSASDQFFAIGNAINKIGNQTEKAAMAMKIFGRMGGQMLTVFAGSNLDDINRTLGKMPDVMKEFSAELERADTLIGRLPKKSDQFFTGFTAGVIGSILPSLELINDQDFTDLGLNLGKALAKGLAPMGNFFKSMSDDITVLSLAASDAFGGANFMDSARQYYAAMDKIDADAEERRKAAAAEDAYNKARDLEHRTAPMWTDPNIAAAAPAAAEASKSAGLTTGFDDYQRRGLSLSNTPTAQNEKKQLDVVIQIHRILQRFTERDGALNWA